VTLFALWLALVVGVPQVIGECTEDDDCTILPSELTCCGECEPAPPFVAVTRDVMDALLLEHETRCARSTRLCHPPTCEAPANGCSAEARCAAGRCVIEVMGCDKPVS